MHCPKCKAENSDRARFCLECGASFPTRCAGCGAELPSRARFCLECGRPVDTPSATPEPRAYTPKHLAEKILTSRSALEGERKHVTILFADVRGSTELASELDPEEWHRIMDRFFQILAEGVHRFEGTVNEYRGGGIMALFGAPIAHENHAQRASYAALHLRDGGDVRLLGGARSRQAHATHGAGGAGATALVPADRSTATYSSVLAVTRRVAPPQNSARLFFVVAPCG
jgi:class 3 adenylate cyclase